ncbi:hypothetical protein F5Y15DRAFT_392985 [Xylariaceae sp. FL0016]|nr:hypothetical protein F5Y15DRAFT_392985 [Xylariaceae sp. FL0016]
MHSAPVLLVSLLAPAAVLATPLTSLKARGISVGYGQQIQPQDDTNHWVVWVEGESACPAAQILGPLTGTPCGQRFTLEGAEYQLGGCASNNEPSELLDAGNSILSSCTTEDDKITCHGDQHDIVKHGKCS